MTLIVRTVCEVSRLYSGKRVAGKAVLRRTHGVRYENFDAEGHSLGEVRLSGEGITISDCKGHSVHGDFVFAGDSLNSFVHPPMVSGLELHLKTGLLSVQQSPRHQFTVRLNGADCAIIENVPGLHSRIDVLSDALKETDYLFLWDICSMMLHDSDMLVV